VDHTVLPANNTTPACLSSEEERVVLYTIKREPSDLGGCVIRRDDFRSVRNEPISME